MSQQSMQTIYAVWRAASEQLVASGVEAREAEQHAEWLLLKVLGWTRVQLLMEWQRAFPDNQNAKQTYQEWVHRRAAGEPVQYILGEQLFYGRPFQVTSDVLIPRPETELLVEHALRIAALCNLAPNLTIADIGSGSGAIAISLAAEMTCAHVIAIDVSERALDVTRKNAEQIGTAARMRFLNGSFLEPIINSYGHENGWPDLIVSNPPYIPTADMDMLQREVREYEPHLALHGGSDGLDPYRVIVNQVGLLKKRPQAILFEVGIGQADDVRMLLEQSGIWTHFEIIPDWQAIGRVVIGYCKE